MAPYSSSSTVLTGLSVILSLSRSSVAQLSSCDTVNCPLDAYRNPKCSVGNVTAQGIGISNFSMPLSNQALTWTVAVESTNAGQSTFERDFFLGTPADLNLENRSSSDTQLCAIFFNGAMNKAMFPGQDPETSQGTCNDALTSACVNDLRKQAQDFRLDNSNSNSTSTENDSSFCSHLGDALRKDAPQSCTAVSGREWSEVQARPLTGTDSPKPLPRGDCMPTTGKDYALTQVESARIDARSRNYTDLKPVLFGVTPILTAMWAPENNTVMASDLSCLKTVGAKQNTTAGNAKGGSERLTVGLGSGSGLLGMLWLSAWIYML